ncbi:MAG: hypothetical protein WD354_02555 [Acidimicrobiia bacterium]
MSRRNLVVGLLGAAALAGLIWAAVVAVPMLTGELTASTPPGGRLAATPNVIESNLVWSTGDGTIGSYVTTASVFGNDGFIYALSTAPGVRDMGFGVPVEHAVYRSQDGLEWTHELLAGFGADLYPRDIAFSGPNLYLVGTAPSAVDPSRAVVRVGTSADSGHTWEAVDLEVANQGGDPAVASAGSMITDVAANGIGTVVGVTSGHQFDQFNPSNVALYVGGGPLGFESTDTPFASGHALDRLAATPDMFYAVVRAPGSNLLDLWQSSDGRQWDQLENFPFLDSVLAFGPIGQRLVVAGQMEGQLVVGATLNGLQWDEVDLVDLVAPVVAGNQWVSAAGIGPAGLYLNVQTWFPNNGPDGGVEVAQLVETPDLSNWSSIPTGSISQGFVDQVIVGDDFVFVNSTTGLIQGRVHLIGTRA